jgi:hypothetical protein
MTTAKRAAGGPKTSQDQLVLVAPAAESGDTLAALAALRNRLAQQLDQTRSGRDVASLSRQLAAVLKQIEEVWRPRPTKRDEIAARRAARRAAAGSAADTGDERNRTV